MKLAVSEEEEEKKKEADEPLVPQEQKIVRSTV